MKGNFYDHEKLKLKRLSRKETRQTVATAVGVDRQHIYRVENGESASIELINALCRYYGMNLHNVIYAVPVER